MKARAELIKEKTELEKSINELLDDFINRNGNVIFNIDVEHIKIPNERDDDYLTLVETVIDLTI